MLILVERGVPFGKEVFRTIGRVRTYDGTSAGRVLPGSSAEVLVVRSNVTVDIDLLNGLPELRVILSPTIGLDHVDMVDFREYQCRLAVSYR